MKSCIWHWWLLALVAVSVELTSVASAVFAFVGLRGFGLAFGF